MKIVCQCSTCQAKFKVDDQYAGRKARCPKCSAITVIPELEASRDSGVSLAAAPTRRTPTIQDSASAIPAVGDSTVGDPAVGDRSRPVDGLDFAGIASPASAAGTAESFTGIAPDSRTSRATATVTRRGAAVKKKAPGNNPPLLWGLIGGGVLALLVLGGGLYFLFFDGAGGDAAPRGVAKLVLDWPSEERKNAHVMINNRTVQLPLEGDVSYELPAGEHHLVIIRRGFEQIDERLTLDGGENEVYAPSWSKVALDAASSNWGVGTAVVTEPVPTGFEGFRQNYDAAKRDAADKGKDLLLLFVGSDWEQKSKSLAQNVLGSVEFKSQVANQFVMVVVDFPRTPAGVNTLFDSAQNSQLRKQYFIRDLPTQVLTDVRGVPYAVDPGVTDNKSEYLERIAKAKADAEQRTRVFQQADQGDPAARLQAAVQALEWLDARHLTPFYVTQVGRWLTLAKQQDGQNQKGLYERFYEAHWKGRLVQALSNDPQSIGKLANELEKWSASIKFSDANRAVELYLLTAELLRQTNNLDAAVAALERATQYKPTNPDLQKRLDEIKKSIKNFNVLSTGTGWAVATGGYILTNNHVIKGPGKIMVRLPNAEEEVSATLVAQDPNRDIALIRLDKDRDAVKPLTVSVGKVGRGSPIAAFGFPLGTIVSSGLKITTGIISGLPDSSQDALLLDCVVNPGNSGGPLCNQQGQVVGMVTAKTSERLGDTYGLAIPAEHLQKFLVAHLPGFKPPAANGPQTPLGWDQVDSLVNPSVMMILMVGRRK